MTFKQAWFSFDGRMRRRDFWLKGFLPVLPFQILFDILVFRPSTLNTDIAAGALVFVCFFPVIAVTLKRLHDRNHSGWFFFVGLIPVIGIIWFLAELGFLRGTEGENQYGKDPIQET